MTLSAELALAVVEAQREIEEAGVATCAALTARRGALAAELDLPDDGRELERRREALAGEAERLSAECVRLGQARVAAGERLEASLASLGQRLLAVCDSEIEARAGASAAACLGEAMSVWEPDLERYARGESASSPARFWGMLPALRDLASSRRARMDAAAQSASEEMSRHAETLDALRDADARLATAGGALRASLGRVAAHFPASQTPRLVDDLLSADVRVLRRVRREFFEGALADARLERERGLARAADPLGEVEFLR